MPSPQAPLKRLVPAGTTILLLDVQERLSATIPDSRLQDVLRASRILIQGGAQLGARVIATEQYPKGLGPTVSPIAQLLQDARAPRIAKIDFSACGSSQVMETLAERDAESIVVLGLEAHICVFQTVRDLCARGHRVQVPVDGVASRRDDHRQIGLELCRASGAELTTAETIVFDWLERAATPEFKAVSALVR